MLTKEEIRYQQAVKRAARERKKLLRLCKESPDVGRIAPFWKRWARKSAQSNRRFFERAERNMAIEQLGPIPHLAHLVVAMGWHRHHLHILIVATQPGVTCPELSETYGLHYPNHRMIFRRLNRDLQKINWRFVSYPIGAQNEPWGWWLENIDQ